MNSNNKEEIRDVSMVNYEIQNSKNEVELVDYSPIVRLP